jgi:hypothetical protein
MLYSDATLASMNDREYKELLRRNCVLASRKHKKYELADIAGCSRQTFSSFLSGGPLGRDYCEALENWLREHGYWHSPEQEAIPTSPRPLSVYKMLAGQLRNLADLMESDVSAQFKADSFAGFVTQYAKGYEAELRRRELE